MNESKKGIWLTAGIAIVIIIALTVLFSRSFNKEQAKLVSVNENQKTTYTRMLSSRDSIVNEAMNTFGQIESDLSALKEKGNMLTIKSANNELTQGLKQQIFNDITIISASLAENKKKMASLSGQFKKAGIQIVGLQAKIAELQININQQEGAITDLKSTLDKKNHEITQLNTTVATQTTVITSKDQKISAQTAELNKAFVVCGTVKALQIKGVVTKSGGFLGIGQTQVYHFTDNLFTQIDVTQTMSIAVNSKNAKFVTNHPANSYKLVKDKDNKIASIEITDPASFWKVSKYAVVETN